MAYRVGMKKNNRIYTRNERIHGDNGDTILRDWQHGGKLYSVEIDVDDGEILKFSVDRDNGIDAPLTEWIQLQPDEITELEK